MSRWWDRARHLSVLLLLGSLVGVACWPLNRIDDLQDALMAPFPAFSGTGWTPPSLIAAGAPLLVMPLLLWLQARLWQNGRGSGIPQTVACVEDPDRAEELLAPSPTLRRMSLWSIASLALLPIGREGPLVQMGAAVAQAVRRRWPGCLPGVGRSELLAAAAGAGLAGGFNTPLMGVIFVAEELTQSFQFRLIWPALLLAAGAAVVSDLGGQPLYALGMIATTTAEGEQAFWAVLLGIGGGLVGGVFGRLMLLATRMLSPLCRRWPLRSGLALAVILSLLAWLTEGQSSGDGERILRHLIEEHGTTDGGWRAWSLLLLGRLIGPALVLGGGIPGGLIDPAFGLGGVFGAGVVAVGGGDPLIGISLGMAAVLAGATQLPVLSLSFAVRMAGDQELLPAILLASTLAAYSGRLFLAVPIYRALEHRHGESEREIDSQRNAQGEPEALRGRRGDRRG